MGPSPGSEGSSQRKEETFSVPQMGRELWGPEVMLSVRIRFPRTDPISDILGIGKGSLRSSGVSATEEPQKDPKEDSQIPYNCFSFHLPFKFPDLSPTLWDP